MAPMKNNSVEVEALCACRYSPVSTASGNNSVCGRVCTCELDSSIGR
jgi:hypothetical protein